MYVVQPFEIITGGMLTASNIPEPDVGEVVWTAGTYNAGDRRILLSTHLVYEALATTTTRPDVGVLETPPKWIVVGYTNRYRMFDQVNNSQSTRASPLTVSITSAKGFNSAALFNVDGITSVRFELKNSSGVTIYDKTIDAIDNSKVVDYWEYFNEPVVQRFKFFGMDIPKTANSTLTVTINGDTTVSVGTMVIGSTFNLGVACEGTGFKTVNLSRLEEDDFGNLNLVKRPNYLLVDYDIRTDRDRLNFITQKLRKDLMNIPCVWAATDNPDDAATVYGYYLDTQNNIDSWIKCTATIQVREIV